MQLQLDRKDLKNSLLRAVIATSRHSRRKSLPLKMRTRAHPLTDTQAQSNGSLSIKVRPPSSTRLTQLFSHLPISLFAPHDEDIELADQAFAMLVGHE